MKKSLEIRRLDIYDAVGVYTIQFLDKAETEFMDFMSKYKDIADPILKEDFNRIIAILRKIIAKGASERLFRTCESKINDRVVAIPLDIRRRKMRRYYTAESVTEGHPDKVCDQIADAILDECLRYDPSSRVACEVLATRGNVFVAGEISSGYEPPVFDVIRKVLEECGYCTDGIEMDTFVHQQSPDIAKAVSVSKEFRDNIGAKLRDRSRGAGDQGVMVGYACDDTPQLMPMPTVLAHRITRELSACRRSGYIKDIFSDGKAQVTVEYVDDKPVRVDTVVVSTQHDPEATQEQIRADIIEHVVKKVIDANLLDENTKYYINPTGRFVIGGPQGDSGLTGRKIIVDTYGGYACHGGGAFSGKDPTKVDRSACYAARYVAKNIVASGIAKKCQVQLAYAIGVAKPVSILINTFGTGKVSDEEITKLVQDNFDLRPAAIIKNFDLRRPIYKQTAAYGHFGRKDLDLPWEKTDKVDVFKF